MTPAANADVGVKVATFVPALYELVPATFALVESLRVKPIVAACTGSLNVAVGAVETATPVAPDAGVVAVTVGGVVSAGPGRRA